MLSWLFGNNSRLNQLESRLINSIANALPESSGKLLEQQVRLINKVQRIDQDREVDLYRMENGKSCFPESMLFADRSDEFELAKLKVSDTATGHETSVVVSLVKGRLFCLEFSHSPRDLDVSSNLRIDVLRVVDPGVIRQPTAGI